MWSSSWSSETCGLFGAVKACGLFGAGKACGLFGAVETCGLLHGAVKTWSPSWSSENMVSFMEQ